VDLVRVSRHAAQRSWNGQPGDGHVETWRCQEANTLAIAQEPPWIFVRPAVTPYDRDLARFIRAARPHDVAEYRRLFGGL